MTPSETIRTNEGGRQAGRPAEAMLLCVMMAMGLLAPSASLGQDWVPFVIPAQVDAEQAIWTNSDRPIATDSGRLATRDGHFVLESSPVRIWGVNLSFGANFPAREDAPHVAARLAAAGVNSVRCHHMDTSRWPRGIWNALNGRTIEPEALDRLDFFIHELAARGIYVNINLHVGRAHSEYIGLPETNRDYDKIAGIFTPALIEAQKEYARELLRHVNPYRGVSYADDPAVAFVEITNEDSFFMWGGEDSLRTLPPYYADLLQERFVQWLRGRYESTQALRAVWSQGTEPLGPTLLQNGGFEAWDQDRSLPLGWNLEQHEGCQASISPSEKGIRVQIDQADETGWHLQLTQGALPLAEGRYYTVSFDASAAASREITCSVSQAHDPWANMGLSRTVTLGTDWSRFRFGFVARADEDNARISFALSGDSASVQLSNVQFRPGGQVGLAEDESLDRANVQLFRSNESRARIVDRMCFLAETEKAYFDDMRSFIKDELGCGALVTGTIVFGPLGLYAQSDMDFIDSHAYWQHPSFPGQPWDQGNWLINQKPMTNHPGEATLFRIAAERLAGKPFTVSEYNHPAPLDAQAECVPMMASFAAAQDWDGVWFYTYSHSGDAWDREVLSGFFDVDTNPAKWGFMRAGTAIFRERAIAPLRSSHIVQTGDPANDLPSLAGLHLQYDRNMLGVLQQAADITYDELTEAVYTPSYGPAPGSPTSSDASGTTVNWSVDDEGRGLYHAANGDTQVYIGHPDRIKRVTRGAVNIASPEFVTLTLTPVDAKRVLVTACGRCENTGMKFSRDRRTVGRNWGSAPVQVEAVEGEITLGEGRWTCEALTPDGAPGEDVSISTGGERSILKLSSKHGTMWYLLERSDR